MKAIYQLRKRVEMHKPQEIIAEIAANNILEAKEIAEKQYGIKVAQIPGCAGLHSCAGTYSLLYKGVVEKTE